MPSLKGLAYPEAIAPTKPRATAGPSTPQFAKCANCFAQDDTFLGLSRIVGDNNEATTMQRQEQPQIPPLRYGMTTKWQGRAIALANATAGSSAALRNDKQRGLRQSWRSFPSVRYVPRQFWHSFSRRSLSRWRYWRMGTPARLPAMRAFHSAGPVLWTLTPRESTATVTGMSFTSNS